MAFRRIIYTSEQRDNIKQDVEKYMESDFYKSTYQTLKTTIKNGVKPDVLVVDINGDGADSVAKKLKVIGIKYDAKVTIKNEIPLDKLKEIIKEAIRTEIKVNKPTWYVPFKELKRGMIGEDYGDRKVVIIDNGTYEEMDNLGYTGGWEEEDVEAFGNEVVAVVPIDDYDFEDNEYDESNVVAYAYDGAGVLVDRNWKKQIPKNENK